MTSPWMTVEEVADLLRFKTPRLARRFLDRERVQPFKRGRINLYRREDVESTLRVTRVMKEAR